MLPNDADKEPLKVLWALHGMTADHTSWLYSTPVEVLAEKYHLCVVIPNADLSFYVDMAYGADYRTFIAEELPQFLRRYFPLSAKPEDNIIAGNSMGGYGAFEIALNYPDVFGTAVSLSGPMYIDWINDILTDETLAEAADSGDAARILAACDAYEQQTGLPRVLIDALMGCAGNRVRRTFQAMYGIGKRLEGTDVDIPTMARKLVEEGKQLKLRAYCGTEDYHYPSNVKFAAYAKELGLDYDISYGSGEHDWHYWNPRIADFMKKIFLK